MIFDPEQKELRVFEREKPQAGETAGGEQMLECPACLSPISNEKDVDFLLFCGKKQCRVTAARIYSDEVKSRDDQIDKLRKELVEADVKIAKLKSKLKALRT